MYQNEANKSEHPKSYITSMYCSVTALSLHELLNVTFKVCRNNKSTVTLSGGSVSDK